MVILQVIMMAAIGQVPRDHKTSVPSLHVPLGTKKLDSLQPQDSWVKFLPKKELKRTDIRQQKSSRTFRTGMLQVY